MNESKTPSQLTKEEALDLLFEIMPDNTTSDNCFDKFGNYVYPTDIIIDTPNVAIGSVDGYHFLNLIDHSNN